MNNKKLFVFPVLTLFLLVVFAFAKTSEAATPNFVTGLGVGSGYKINFSANTDGVTWTAGTGGSINATNYTGNSASSDYALTAGSVSNAETANALASNPSNCTAGYYPLGIDSFGNVENCTAASGGGVGGSGTINYVSKWSSATGLTNSLIFDNATNVGIGLTNPGAKLDVNGGSIRTTNQFISTLAIGTAPLVVTSNTLVSNLNADLLDGQDASAMSVLYAASSGSATNASTANALAANGANCSAGYYPLGVNASGAVESCTVIPADTDAQQIGYSGNNITLTNGGAVVAPYATTAGSATTANTATTANSATTAGTANALAVNGTNCSAGYYPLGIDTAGNAESCTAASGGGVAGSGTINFVSKWSSATGLTNSLIFDNATNVGIGTSTPGARLDVTGGSIRTSNQFISTLAAGTAPLVVTSNTLVSNLNADLLDGQNASAMSVLYAVSAGSATNASTANALAANGSNCSTGYYPLGVDAAGAVETCTAVPADSDAQQIGYSGNNITLTNGGAVVAPYATTAGSATTANTATTANSATTAGTANALAVNGTNCSAGYYPLGIDTAGNAESCTAAGAGSVTGSGTINFVSKWSSATGLTNSLIFDNATNVGIGTSTPGARLDVTGGSIRTSNQFISTLAAGTAPLVVTSNTLVTNLNADLLDGQNASAMSVLYAVSAGSATNASTANALAANGTNCSAGYYPLGVDAAGAVETCTAVPATHNAVTLAAIGTTPNANGMTLSTQQINLEPASASFGGVVTTGAQTFAGAKTFNGGIIGTLTGNASSATALAANGTNCTAGNYPLGIDASGNVESCTSIPGGISGSGTLNYVTKWSSGTGLTNSLLFDNATNVGIGLTNPGAKLDVNGGSIRTTNQFISTLAAGTAPLVVTSNTVVANLNADLLDGQNASAMSVLYATSAGSATSATTATSLAANGANCSAGYYPLGVNASGAVESCTADLGADNLGDHRMAQNLMARGFWISDDGDNEGILIDAATGGVSISTTTFSTTLNLGGRPGVDGLMFPDSTIQKTAFTGYIPAANVSAGQFGLNIGGGNYSFPANLSIGTTQVGGTLNVQDVNPLGTGVVVIKSRTSSMGIPFIRMVNSTGTVFLDINANCQAETFIGYGAGASAQLGTCTGSLYVGGYAGNANSGGMNVALGPQAMSNAAVGGNNTAVGVNTMQNTNGSGNVALGKEAMFNNRGSNNVAVGNSALQGSDTSSYNIAIGPSALNDGGGGNSVGIGAGAGATNVAGNNVFIGHQAGYTNFTGSGNVFLGYQAGYNESGSDLLYIDNSNTATPLIKGDFSANRVSINSATQTQTLTVGGNIAATGYYSGATAGLSRTIIVKGSSGVNCNIVVTTGLITSTTCP